MASIIVFVLLIVFSILFILDKAQSRKLWLAGHKEMNPVQRWLLKKGEDFYYAINMGFLTILLVIGGAIYNSGSGDVMTSTPPGAWWSALYFGVASVFYGWVCLRNKSLLSTKS